MTIQEAKTYGKANLPGSPTPELDTDVILQHATGFDRTHLLLNRGYVLTAEQEAAFAKAIGKRATGLPVAYITHEKEFYGRIFYVDENVLIPKPDTETLIEKALETASEIEKSKSFNSDFFRICDLCSGSGCIGITFLKELLRTSPGLHEKAEITFIDISESALKVTMLNAVRIFAESENGKARFFRSDLFESLDGNSAVDWKFDLILTNPPYIPSKEAADLLKDGRSEPILALDGLSGDGLGIIRRLLPQAFGRLKKGGKIIMETGEYNAKEAAALMEECGFSGVHITKDMNGMDRDVSGTKA